MSIQIFLVENRLIVRKGLKCLLEKQHGFKIKGESASSKDAFKLIEKNNVVILSADIFGANEIKLIRQLKNKFKDSIKILMIGSKEDESGIKNGFVAGINGYISSNCEENELLKAIEKIMNGDRYCEASVLKIITQFLSDTNQEEIQLRKNLITKRETEILLLLARGMHKQEVGNMLGLSPKTVQNHKVNILRKLEVKSSIEMLVKSLQLRIINIGDI